MEAGRVVEPLRSHRDRPQPDAIPTGPNDGLGFRTVPASCTITGSGHFSAYDYRVFALYRLHTRPGT